MKCKEHEWKVNGGVWVCERCQEEAAAKDLVVLPCPKCGAPVEPELIYCGVCLDKIYRLEMESL
jgi:predicted amidophosphoribosyltransferase